jgi:hypothetical protein
MAGSLGEEDMRRREREDLERQKRAIAEEREKKVRLEQAVKEKERIERQLREMITILESRR